MFHIYAVSDGTGKTAEGVVRAALTQYDDSNVKILTYGGVREWLPSGAMVLSGHGLRARHVLRRTVGVSEQARARTDRLLPDNGAVI